MVACLLCLANHNCNIMIETKKKGNLTELECITELTRLGYLVSIPFGEDSRYDCIVDINNKLYRIQCKTGSEQYDENNVVIGIHFKTCRQSGNCAKISTRTKYTKEEIDFFATSYQGKCYLVPVEECSVEKLLRIVPPKNGQKKGVSFLKDYEASEVRSKL